MNPYADVYRLAARRIRTDGWCHHGALTPDGHVCILIAIFMASRERMGEDEIRLPAEAAARYLTHTSTAGTTALIHWNEDPDRTQEHVLGLLDKLAEAKLT